MTNDNPTRADVVLSKVADTWRTTTMIDGRLYDAGFTWSTETTRSTLTSLAATGLIERRKAGAGYEWRRVPTPAAEAVPTAMGAQARRDTIAILDELRATIEQAQKPVTPPAEGLHVADDADLADLLHADDQLVTRIVKRAAYDALRMMLIVLDGWIEGARENNEAMGRRNDDGPDGPEWFHAEHVRRMVNDAARASGVREPYQEGDANAPA